MGLRPRTYVGKRGQDPGRFGLNRLTRLWLVEKGFGTSHSRGPVCYPPLNLEWTRSDSECPFRLPSDTGDGSLNLPPYSQKNREVSLRSPVGRSDLGVGELGDTTCIRLPRRSGVGSTNRFCASRKGDEGGSRTSDDSRGVDQFGPAVPSPVVTEVVQEGSVGRLSSKSPTRRLDR